MRAGALPSQVPEAVTAEMIEMARETPAGAFVELGVFQGGTAWHLNELALEQGRQLYLYDTFAGMPWSDHLDSHKVGDFSDTNAAAVKAMIPHAHVIPGIFPGSAVLMGDLAFVHLDCDQYRSYTEALPVLWPLLVPGGVLWADDSPYLGGAHQAMREFFQASQLLLSRTGKHYVVR